MVTFSEGDVLKVTIGRISNSGNAIVPLGDDGGHINLGKVQSDVGEEVVVKVHSGGQNMCHAHPVSSESSGFDPSKSTSISQHRSMESSTAGIEERDFDPRTHGAPEISRPEPKRYDSTDDAPTENEEGEQSSPDLGSLMSIGSSLDTPLKEEQQERPREDGDKKEWGMKTPVNLSKKP